MPYSKNTIYIPPYSIGSNESISLEKLRDNDIKNMIFFDENLKVMGNLLRKGFGGSIDMIYIDPPFFSENMFSIKNRSGERAYDDRWKNDMQSYLKYLEKRIVLMKELLKDSGSIFVHLDWHASHYVKVMMDRIFGMSNFRNEIIWHYYMGGKSKKEFARKHDVILYYSKGRKWKFNPQKIKRRIDFLPKLPLKSSTGNALENTYFKDEIGWYSVVTADDVWDVHGVFNLGREYSGYPTQKPLEILERIIAASTDSGDIVADFFMGSGTSMVASSSMGRHFIGCDNSYYAVTTTIERLMNPDKMKFKDHYSQGRKEDSCFQLMLNMSIPRKRLASILQTKTHCEEMFQRKNDITFDNILTSLTKKLDPAHIILRDRQHRFNIFSNRFFIGGEEKNGLVTYLSKGEVWTLNIRQSQDIHLFLFGNCNPIGKGEDNAVNTLKVENLCENLFFNTEELLIKSLKIREEPTNVSVSPDLISVGVSGRDQLPVILKCYPYHENGKYKMSLPATMKNVEWIFQRFSIGCINMDIYVRSPLNPHM